MDNLLNHIFYQPCIFCHGRNGIFCTECLVKCQLLYKDYCLVCETYSGWGVTHEKCSTNVIPTEVFSCFNYEGLVRECIKKSKYGSKRFAALKVLAAYGFTYAFNCGLNYGGFKVVSIPVSAVRLRERGFNQSEILSGVFAKIFGLPVENKLLVRGKNTAVQHSNSRIERFRNIEGAFELNTKKGVGGGEGEGEGNGGIGGKFVLVDDIITSGATFLEAAKVLYNAGASEVRCVALSRRLLRNAKLSM